MKGKEKKKKSKKYVGPRFQIVSLGYEVGRQRIPGREMYGIVDHDVKNFLRGGFDKEHVIAFANYLNAHPNEAGRFQYA